MAKLYDIHGGKLYIFVDGSDELMDMRFFPSMLNLFEIESYWRISPKIAISEYGDEDNLKRVLEILETYGYKRARFTQEKLEEYYLHGGDELIFRS